jgi:hypothetical protein
LWSYRLAADNLEELCGISLSHTTVGEIAANTAGEMAVKMENHPEEIRKAFQQAKGEGEFYADGTFVHVRNDEDKAEWREMKVGAFAKRERGGSAMPSEWHTRKLPKPTVVSAFAAIEGKEEFQERCQRERRRLGVGGVSSALGDGAKWIWNIVWEVFGETEECLDIYHGAEHLSDCGKIVFSDSVAQTEWFERIRLVLISEGFSGVERELDCLKVGLNEKQLGAVDSLLEYLRTNAKRLSYRERLAAGRVIGSGLIEGACKNLVGKRMKQTGTCWRLPRANQIATLCAVLYSHQWKAYWKNSY